MQVVTTSPRARPQDRRTISDRRTTPNTEIAPALGITETTIRNRGNGLIDEELIEFVAIVTPRAE
ncbi:hypothetical protein [Rhodococcus pyridinivorans]